MLNRQQLQSWVLFSRCMCTSWSLRYWPLRCNNKKTMLTLFSRVAHLLDVFLSVGLVPKQKSEIPEAGETVAEGPDTDPRLPRCHDEEYLSWRQQGLSTLSPSSQQHKWHKSLSPGEAPLRHAGRSRNFIIIDTRRFARSPVRATRRHGLDHGK